MQTKGYLDAERIRAEGLTPAAEKIGIADDLIRTIISLSISSEYGFMLDRVQEAMEGDKIRLSQTYDFLHDLRIIRTAPGQTGPGRAGSALIYLNFGSPYWDLGPTDALAYLGRFSPEEIARKEFLIMKMLMAWEDCPPGEEKEKLAALLEGLKREHSYKGNPLVFLKEIVAFIRKKSSYDHERRGGSVSYQKLIDFFEKRGYDKPDTEEAVEYLIEEQAIQEDADDNLFMRYMSAADIYIYWNL